MFGSKLTVSEETRVYKDLTPREKGKIRWERLKEQGVEGAKTRKDVAELGGYDREDSKGSSWVNNLVNRGYLAEIVESRKGQMRTCRYALTGKEPFHRRSRRRQSRQVKQDAPIIRTEPVVRTARVVVEYCGITITIENGGAEYVGKIVKAIR